MQTSSLKHTSFTQVFSDFGAQHRALLLSTAFWSLTISSPLGLSTLLALASDLLALATCHVSLLYWLSALIYSAQLRALSALWRLFRGRKRNPLRHRVDSFECHVEQIVVGSLLFTPLLLLLPTTWAYYSLFAMTYGGIAAARAALQIGGAVIRSFPVYWLAVWATVPGAFPSDVSFQVTSAGQKARVETGWTSNSGPENAWEDGEKTVASTGERVDDSTVTSAGWNAATGTEVGDGMFTRGRKGGSDEKRRAANIRPRADERNVRGEELTERKGGDGREGTESDERSSNVGKESIKEDWAGHPAGAKLAGLPSEDELEARHLRLELVTADARKPSSLEPFWSRLQL